MCFFFRVRASDVENKKASAYNSYSRSTDHKKTHCRHWCNTLNHIVISVKPTSHILAKFAKHDALPEDAEHDTEHSSGHKERPEKYSTPLRPI
ncbi:hypothetical protein BaRGS_00018074 [Batillaria attramentaria]|uniref:Uncharacterized protein n=1 Tax=Batillaria attramentaria TaxID=370345 RepID=A0ABD0KUA3_9CAEN